MANKPMMPDDGEMDSLYSDDTPEAKAKGEAQSVDEEAAEEQTALVPTKLLQPKDGKPLKVGDEIVVKISAIHGDEAEIAYATGGKGGTGDEGPSADDELESLSSAGNSSGY